MAKAPTGTVQEVERERENGHLQYSYDIKVPGQEGITEVNVDALTGSVIGVEHEGAEAGEKTPEKGKEPAKGKAPGKSKTKA